MKKPIINITSWPYGIGLDFEDYNGGGSIVIGGPHGGGIGKTMHRIPINLEKLKEAITRWEEQEKAHGE